MLEVVKFFELKMPLLIIVPKTTQSGINLTEDRQVFYGLFLKNFYVKILMKIKNN